MSALRTWVFAAVMAVVAGAIGLWVVYDQQNAAGWVIVIAAAPWALLALLRLSGGPKRM